MAAAIALSIPAYSSDGVPPISPEELKMTSEPLAPGAPAIILYRKVDRDDSGSQDRETDFYRIKILTEEGRKYADIEIPYLKGGGSNVLDVSARTIEPDGRVVPFRGKPFDKSIVKGRDLRYMAKTFTMPDVQVGSIIEYSYTLDMAEYLVFDSHWIVSDDLFTREADFSLKPYPEFTLRWNWHSLPPGSAQPKADGRHIIRLHVQNIPAFQTEDYMPPVNELKSRVDFTYTESRIDQNHPEEFWKSKGKSWNSHLEDFVGKHKAMEEAVAQIVSPNDPPQVKLQKIYARVQQLRNTSYEVEKTAQEEKRSKEKDADNVEQVWKRGAGNGTQLTWLFLGLVRAAGFDAHGAWVSDRADYFFSPNSLDDHKLNANVVQVKLDGKELYFDPGAAYVPFGLLPWEETACNGLLLDKNGGEWIKTPVPDASASRIARKADLHLTDSGGLEGTVTLTFTGLEALRLRVNERNEDEAARKKFLEDRLAEDIPAAATIELTNKPEWSSSSPEFTAQYNIKIGGWMSGTGRRAFLPVGLFTAGQKHIFDHAERVHPIYFDYPYSREDDVTILLPLGMQVASLPPPMEANGGAVVSYEFKADKTNANLHWTRKFSVNFLYLEQKYYPTLRSLFQTIKTDDDQQVVLQPIEAHHGY